MASFAGLNNPKSLSQWAITVVLATVLWLAGARLVEALTDIDALKSHDEILDTRMAVIAVTDSVRFHEIDRKLDALTNYLTNGVKHGSSGPYVARENTLNGF